MEEEEEDEDDDDDDQDQVQPSALPPSQLAGAKAEQQLAWQSITFCRSQS